MRIVGNVTFSLMPTGEDGSTVVVANFVVARSRLVFWRPAAEMLTAKATHFRHDNHVTPWRRPEGKLVPLNIDNHLTWALSERFPGAKSYGTCGPIFPPMPKVARPLVPPPAPPPAPGRNAG